MGIGSKRPISLPLADLSHNAIASSACTESSKARIRVTRSARDKPHNGGNAVTVLSVSHAARDTDAAEAVGSSSRISVRALVERNGLLATGCSQIETCARDGLLTSFSFCDEDSSEAPSGTMPAEKSARSRRLMGGDEPLRGVTTSKGVQSIMAALIAGENSP